MKNFKDIKTNDINYQVLVSDSGKINLQDINIVYNLENINIPGNSLLIGNNYYEIGENLFFIDNEINYYIDTKIETPELFGDFFNLQIKDNSIGLEKLEHFSPQILYSSEGPLNIGGNLQLNNSVLEVLGDKIVNPELLCYNNPVNITENGIYFLDDESPNIISINPEVNRAFIINKSGKIVYLNNFPIYQGETSLFSFSIKIKTNYVGTFEFDEEEITDQIGTEYSINNIYLSNITVNVTEEWREIIGYSLNKNLSFKVEGVLGEEITNLFTISTVDYGIIRKYTLKTTENLGNYDSDGLFIGSFANRLDGNYNIYAKDSNFNDYKLVYIMNISTKPAIYSINTTLVENTNNLELILNSKNNIIDFNNYIKILDPTNTISRTQTVTGQELNIDDDQFRIEDLNINTLTFDINFTNNNVSITSPGRFIFEVNAGPFIPNVGRAVVSIVLITSVKIPLKVPNYINPIILDNLQELNVNVFEYFEFLGENISIISGTKTNFLVDSFGTINLSSNGNLRITPIEFSNNSYDLEFRVRDKYNEELDVKIPLRFRDPNYNESTHWRVDITGAFSELGFMDSEDNLTLIFKDESITKSYLSNYSTGSYIVSPDINNMITSYFLNTINEMNYYSNKYSQNIFKTASKKSYVDCPLPNGCYPIISTQIEFNNNKKFKKLYIFPAKNNEGEYILEPQWYKLYKSVDNGSNWELFESGELNREINDSSWEIFISLKLKELEVEYWDTFFMSM